MISIVKVGNRIESRLVREFIADLETDIDNLPHISRRGLQGENQDDPINDCVLAGSTCFVIETSQAYMLGNDDIWHRI